MKSFVVIIIIFQFATSLYAQSPKIKLKDDIVFVDDKESFKMVKTNKQGLSSDYSVQNLKGEELFYIKFDSYVDYSQRDASNPDGTVNYWVFIFPDSAKSWCETDMTTGATPLAKKIIENKLIVGDILVENAVQRFAAITGTKHSDRRKELYPNVQIEIYNH